MNDRGVHTTGDDNQKSDQVATQLKARGDLIGLGFDWFNV